MKRTFAVILVSAVMVVSAQASVAEATVVVMSRADGSKQCEPKLERRAISKMLANARRELRSAGVRPLEVRRLESDGKMHMQMCGSPTGAIIQIRVRESDREKAQKLGFSAGSDKAAQ